MNALRRNHIYVVDYYSDMKKKEILLFVTTVNWEDSMLSEISQREKDKYSMLSHE